MGFLHSQACQVGSWPSVPSAGRVLQLMVCLAGLLMAMASGVSHAQAISSRRLLEVTDLGNPVISPDGRQVAFRSEQASVERNAWDTSWYVQDVHGDSAPIRVADGGTPLRQYINGVVMPAPALWSPDGKWIYYRALLDGRVSVWRAAADGSGAVEVTSDPADVRDFRLSADGRALEYSVGATRREVIHAEQAEYDRGIRIDDTVNIAAGLFRSSRLNGRPATQRLLGEWFSAGPLLSGEPDRWKVVDLVAWATSDLPASEWPAGPLSPADLSPDLPAEPVKLPNGMLPPQYHIVANPDDQRIALLLPGPEDKQLAASRYVQLAVLSDRHSAQPAICGAEPCSHKSISRIQWRPGSDEILFTVTSIERTQSIYAWNVITGHVRPVLVSAGLLSGSQRYWDIPCGLSADTLVCVAAEADHPPRLEAISLDDGERKVLFAPNRQLDLDIAATTPAELIHWNDAQGREFSGRLFEARGSGNGQPPLFVNFYDCYGFLRGGLGDETPFATLAGNGISALCINGIPEYRLDPTARYDQGRAAVEGVVKLLSVQGRIDRSRVGMGGLSYGSEVTMWTLAHSDVVSVASVSSPSVTPLYYLFNSVRDSFRTSLKNAWQLGAPEEAPAGWKKVSPASQLDRIKVPILFQMNEQEYRMALDYALPLERRHQADIYVFPDEPHIKFQPRHKLAVYERNIDWFRFWLQGFEDPDPGKIEQYHLWHGMGAADAGRRPVANAGHDH